MIAPEPGEGINPQTSRPSLTPSLTSRALLLSAGIFTLLEVWRPYFFLTDDSLDGGYPFFVEIGRNLLAGHSPFISQHLFGGGYNLLRDPTFFLWHPVYLIVSLLAGTPFKHAIVDVDAFVFLMLATGGFVTLALHLRRELNLAVGDGWILFYTLSFTYSMIALTTGASWLSFLGDHGALPWLTLGILLPDMRRGIACVALFCLHQVLGGHLAPTVSNSIFLSLFALGMCLSRRSAVPMINWLAGYAIALVFVSPLLVPMLEGFFSSMRSHGVTLEDMQANNIPAQHFFWSILVGTALWLTHPHEHPYTTYTLALGSSAAAWCIIPALVSRSKWRGIEVVTAAMLFFGAVLICRPLFITEVMMHLPLFRSMRWPFREFVQFQFFLHLFFVLRPPGLNRNARLMSAIYGAGIFIVPLVLYPFPPTFNTMTWDRELLLSGGADRYWEKVRPLLQPGDRVAVIIPAKLYEDDRFEEPYTLLGSYNYAADFGFINAWGYSPTAPSDQLYTKTYAYYPFGAYRPYQRDALFREKPGIKFITLESLHPLQITLSSGTGPTIDLTPFVPERHSKIPADAALLRQQEAEEREKGQ